MACVFGTDITFLQDRTSLRNLILFKCFMFMHWTCKFFYVSIIINVQMHYFESKYIFDIKKLNVTSFYSFKDFFAWFLNIFYLAQVGNVQNASA